MKNALHIMITYTLSCMHTVCTYVRVYVCYCIVAKIHGIKFRVFALEQNISQYKFRDLRAGITRLYCDISKFAG